MADVYKQADDRFAICMAYFDHGLQKIKPTITNLSDNQTKTGVEFFRGIKFIQRKEMSCICTSSILSLSAWKLFLLKALKVPPIVVVSGITLNAVPPCIMETDTTWKSEHHQSIGAEECY